MKTFDECARVFIEGFTPKSKHYLAQQRKLSPDRLERKLCAGNEDFILFPYVLWGKIVRFKLRSLADKSIQYFSEWRQDVEEKIPFFNQKDFADKSYLIVTEGEFDALAAQELGFENAVSLPNGAQSLRKTFEEHYRYLQQYEQIYICMDSDEAGKKAVEMAQALLSPHRRRVIRLDVKDVNDGLLNWPDAPSTFYNAFVNAEREVRDSVQHLSKCMLAITEEVKGGYATGFQKLDYLLKGIRLHELTIITGDTGSGKTSFACQMLITLSYKTKVYLNTYEMSNRRIVQKLGAIRMQKSPSQKLNPEELKRWYDFAQDSNIYLNFRVGLYTLEDLIQDIEYAYYVERCEIVLVDHLAYLSATEKGEDERKEIDYIIEKLFDISRRIPIHIFLVAHMKGLSDDIGELQMWKIKGSSQIKQVADNIIGVQRLERSDAAKKNKVIIKVMKNRECGKEGKIELNFDDSTETFYEEQDINWRELDVQDSEFQESRR